MNLPQRNCSSIWRREWYDVLRAGSGAFLFGIPLLYTVEVWSIGASTRPQWMLLTLAITFVVVYLLNQTEGFRRTLEVRSREAAIESVEAMGIGIACAFLALVLLQRVTLATPLSETLGKLVVEGIPFSFGVALARSALSGDRRASKRRLQTLSHRRLPFFQGILFDLDATLIGALIVAFSIAPTEEIHLLAASIAPPWLLAIMVCSLVISYGIVFAAGFTNECDRRQQPGLLQRPISETAISYLVCLLASALMLWLFQQLSWGDPWQEWLSDTLVLGLPAAIGGAAGRIAI